MFGLVSQVAFEEVVWIASRMPSGIKGGRLAKRTRDHYV
eukprot:COSAG06_NODE_29311_length_559_cov_0.515217_1_plen_38_part_01